MPDCDERAAYSGASRWAVWCWGLLIPTLFAPQQSQAADTPVWSIERLNAAKADWPLLTQVDLKVEGRVSSQIKSQMRFQQCSLSFVLPPEFERRAGSAKQVEVTGRLQREGSNFVFLVQDLKAIPTDLELLRSREVALKNVTPANWYELADWAKQRAEFYRDTELAEAGMVYLTRGLTLEHVQLAADDYQGRLQLADKVRKLELPEKLADELQFEGYRLWWNLAGSPTKPEPDQLAKLETELQRVWPDAVRPGSAFPTELQQRFHEQPLESYRMSEPGARQTLRRILAAEVQLQRLLLQLKPDGSNGRELAQQMRTKVPERPQPAARLVEAELSYRLGQVTSFSRQTAIELANELREHGRATEASEGLLRWLVHKEQRLRPQTAPEFVELADDYLSLLKDEQRAVALLLEAHRKEPESADVLQRFAQLGYVYNGITWSRPKEPPLPSADPRRPTTTSPLTAGMTSGELSRLLGEPGTRSRTIAAGSITEFWIYGRLGEGPRLVVELRRSDPKEPMRIVHFYQR